MLTMNSCGWLVQWIVEWLGLINTARVTTITYHCSIVFSLLCGSGRHRHCQWLKTILFLFVWRKIWAIDTSATNHSVNIIQAWKEYRSPRDCIGRIEHGNVVHACVLICIDSHSITNVAIMYICHNPCTRSPKKHTVRNVVLQNFFRCRTSMPMLPINKNATAEMIFQWQMHMRCFNFIQATSMLDIIFSTNWSRDVLIT